MNNDTVFIVEGRILSKYGKDALSSNAKQQINKLRGLMEGLTHLKTAYEAADENSKKTYEKKVNKAERDLENFEARTLSFLKTEENDLSEKKRIADEEAAKQQRLADEEAAKQQRIADEEAEKQRLADEEAEKQRLADEEAAEQQRIADEEAEKQRLADEEAAEQQRIADEKSKKPKKSNFGTILVTSMLVLVTGGLILMNKNK